MSRRGVWAVEIPLKNSPFHLNIKAHSPCTPVYCAKQSPDCTRSESLRRESYRLSRVTPQRIVQIIDVALSVTCHALTLSICALTCHAFIHLANSDHEIALCTDVKELDTPVQALGQEHAPGQLPRRWCPKKQKRLPMWPASWGSPGIIRTSRWTCSNDVFWSLKKVG